MRIFHFVPSLQKPARGRTENPDKGFIFEPRSQTNARVRNNNNNETAMKNFIYSQPTRIVFGEGTHREIGKHLQSVSRRVLLHYGSASAVKSGLIDRTKLALEQAGIYYRELGGVQPNPRLSLVREGIGIVRSEGLDAILAVGGGSVIDSAKAIGMGAVYPGGVWDFFQGTAVPQACLPIATVLTIPAAGSEASDSCVITDERGPFKKGIHSSLVRPTLSILDPTLTYTLPAYQTAAGGTDIMAHVMERYFTNEQDVDLTDRLCEAVLQTIIANLPRALADPRDYAARAQMMWASSLAHNDLLSTGRTGDWASHAIAHQPSALYDLTHGAALAIIFPAWMRHVYRHDTARFVRFAVRVWGIEQDVFHPERTALQGIERTEAFFAACGMPTRFSQAGILDERFGEMADRATSNGTLTLGHFVPLTREDIFRIYCSAR